MLDSKVHFFRLLICSFICTVMQITSRRLSKHFSHSFNLLVLSITHKKQKCSINVIFTLYQLQYLLRRKVRGRKQFQLFSRESDDCINSYIIFYKIGEALKIVEVLLLLTDSSSVKCIDSSCLNTLNVPDIVPAHSYFHQLNFKPPVQVLKLIYAGQWNYII